LSGETLHPLAEEQAALRRVATLVARGTPPDEVFAAVIHEVGHLLRVDLASMGRYDSDKTLTFVAAWGIAGEHFPVGSHQTLGGENLGTIVLKTGRSARIDNYADSASGPIGLAARDVGINSSIGTPIMVEGRVWGVMAAGSTQEQPLPASAEARLESFTELVATAIANAESRAALARLAEEQAALRRVATLVARRISLGELIESVSAEVGRLIPADAAGIGRYETDGTGTALGGWSREGPYPGPPTGTPFALEPGTTAALVFETRRPGRIAGYQGIPGAAAGNAREAGWRSAVGAPITVEGRLWGFVSVASKTDRPFPPDTEDRLAQFTDLVATAIVNAESRAELMASRTRIADAADKTRRRIERELHDGIQQRLVALAVELRAAQVTVPPHLGELEGELSRVAEGLTAAFYQLREISRGIHPAILSEGGLEPALRALCRRSALPVDLDLNARSRLPEPFEAAVYSVVSEALTNATTHAHASRLMIELTTHGEILRLVVRDDGVGGADPNRGSGLVGLSDRIEALGGTLQIISRPAQGTTLLVDVPLDGHSGAAFEP
jgi:signal transduction histidine kinase